MSEKPQLTTEQRLRMAGMFTAFMLMLGAVSFNGIREDLHRASFSTVQGTVLKAHQYTGYSRASKARVPKLVTDVQYKFLANGKEFTKTETSEWISDLQAKGEYAHGKPITIYVNPNDATEATMVKARDIETDKITAGLFAVAFVVGLIKCILLFLKLKRESTAG